MACKLLNGRDVHAEIEHVADERSPQVVRREARDLGTTSETTNEIEDALIGHPPHDDRATLRHRHEERTGKIATAFEPRIESETSAVRDIRDALLVALPLHFQHAGRPVEVFEVERDDLAPPKTTAVQDREQGRVPPSMVSTIRSASASKRRTRPPTASSISRVTSAACERAVARVSVAIATRHSGRRWKTLPASINR
jgi:hypothetical protein